MKFKYSKDRKLWINILFCVLSFLCLLLFSSIFELIIKSVIHNEYTSNILANLITLALLYLMYKKDLDKEAKTFVKTFKTSFKRDLKYYAIGVLLMMFFNMVLVVVLNNIAANETQVRELLFSHTLYALLYISILAPIMEEIIFRKSLQPVIKNKWIYVIACGVLFGLGHILTNIFSGSFALTDLFYILPYGSLGSSFALMDYEGKSTFNSIMVHAMHNTATAILLLAFYMGGILG